MPYLAQRQSCGKRGAVRDAALHAEWLILSLQRGGGLGGSVEENGATVMRWDTGQVISLRPVEGALDVEVSVPDDGDLDGSSLR